MQNKIVYKKWDGTRFGLFSQHVRLESDPKQSQTSLLMSLVLNGIQGQVHTQPVFKMPVLENRNE